MTSARPRGPESWAPCALVALAVLPFLPSWLRGFLPYWGDLTYIHHPWRAYDASVLAEGRVPLWNPYLYFGMPQAASMQDGLLYPGTLPFFLLGFPAGLALFQAFHYALAGLLTYWWLRSLRLGRAGALAGAVVWQLGGVLMSRMLFLNHLAVLSLVPGLLLFFGTPALLGLCLALAFLAGYPTFLMGAAAAACFLGLLLSPERDRPRWLARAGAGWLAAGLLALGLGAVLLLPAAELFRHSRRASGVELSEALTYGFSPRDLARWVSPLLEGWSRFDPAVEWWKCCYLGFAGWAAAGLGLARLERRRALALALAGGLFVLLILGDSNSASRGLWAALPFLRFIRYPGNVAYLALPALSLLVAAGCAGPRGRRLALAVVVELAAYGLRPFPAAPASLFATPGPLVRRLQAELGAGRYLLSPLALYAHDGMGVGDWKTRLYGLTNAPFRIRAAANFGEPLVPRPSYDYMDALHGAVGARDAARLLSWAGVRFLMAPKRLEVPGVLAPEGRLLWETHRVLGPVALAYLFAGGDGDIPKGLPRAPVPASARPLASLWSREDAFEVGAADGPEGWLFLSEPRFRGWRTWLQRPGGPAEAVKTEPAALAFKKVRVPAGPWILRSRYDPRPWRLGAALTALSLMALAAYWYNRLLRSRHAP